MPVVFLCIIVKGWLQMRCSQLKNGNPQTTEEKSIHGAHLCLMDIDFIPIKLLIASSVLLQCRCKPLGAKGHSMK